MARGGKSRLTPAQIGQKWSNGLANAAAAYVAGCTQPKRDPIQAATTPEASAAYLAGVQRSESLGLRVNRLREVGTQGWLNGCKNKGAANLTAAGQRKLNNYVDAIINLQDVWLRMRQAADAITGPKSMALSIQKATAALQVLMQQGRKQGGAAAGFGP